MADHDVVALARAVDVWLIRFLNCDNGGIIRGKSTYVDDLEERLRTGIGLTVAMQAMNSVDRLAAVDGLGPVGEVRLIPDPTTFVVLPYAPRTAAMIADLRALDRRPWDVCPREFLRRVERRARDYGLALQVGFDSEWSLATRDDEPRPADESLCFSTIGMTTGATVVDDIVSAFAAQGLHPEQYYPELGHGQQELSTRHAPAMRAADHQIYYRETVPNVVERHGFRASFAPKPWPDQAGNGCHVHFSAWDLVGKNNLFYTPDGKYLLSQLGYHFLAGVLAHLPALVALTCPSVNSYRRLVPQSWASAFTCFGPDNREAAVRIVSPSWGKEAESVRLELKPADNSANPYIAIGGILAAGLDGVRRELIPVEGQLALVDPSSMSAAERSARGIRELPSSLDVALNALERDEVLLDALGGPLAAAFLAVRRSEAEYFATTDLADEYRAHFYKY